MVVPDVSLITYVLEAPITRVAAMLLGWVCGIVCGALIARVAQR